MALRPNIKGGRLQIVPWYNKKEWEETYQQIYSDNSDMQEKAYSQMCIWKTRLPDLPLGVECTMSVLHVRLCDKQAESNASATPYQHRDLQLLYSTAVMRFLNQLTVTSNCKDSMYKMAEQKQIPDWLINLRHEAAHGNSVPALYLLREASDVILQWLRENYWLVEAEAMRDHVSDREEMRESYCKSIKELLELWVVLKVNYWARNKTIDKIPSEDIRFIEIAMELANEEGIGIKRSAAQDVKPSPTKIDSHNDSIVGEEEMEFGEEGKLEYTHKLKTAFEPLLRRLFDPLKGKPYVRNFYLECLIECLVKFESFCPQIDPNNLSEKELLQLMWLQCQLWREVVGGLQVHHALHCLLPRLGARGTSGHMWLRLLSQLLSGDPPPPPPRRGSEDVCLLLAESLPCHINPQVLHRRMREKHNPYDLEPPTAQDILALQEIAHEAVHKPTPFTTSYIKSLLRFWEDGLSAESVAMLAELTQLYNGSQTRKGRALEKVHTLASLLDRGLVVSDSEDNGSSRSQVMSPWKLYSGDADWSRCALGMLPWQT